MPTCKIQWIDSNGTPTPDNRPAIGYVRRDAWREYYPTAVNGYIDYTQSEWFPICAEHAARLREPDMHWTFKKDITEEPS